ncbi:15043_t:CDS:1, partial [Acaulospora morrowiae]
MIALYVTDLVAELKAVGSIIYQNLVDTVLYVASLLVLIVVDVNYML